MRVEDVKTSRLDKVFYPDDQVTKGDVIEHYRTVADVMVPHLRGRPLTLRRYPNGIQGESWFQKEAASHFPEWIRVEKVPQRGHDGEYVYHVICDDAATLVYLANQATLEFHIWISTVDAIRNPDLLVIDIDPPDGAAVANIREIAQAARQLFEAIGLTPFVQATGGRGFHVVTPLDSSAGHDVVTGLAREAAAFLASKAPALLTTAQRKNKRGNKVFLDTARNGYAQTFISPYSLRSRPGAAVATPLEWDELSKAEPNGYTIDKIRRRLAQKADPWRDIHAHAASAEEARSELAGLS